MHRSTIGRRLTRLMLVVVALAVATSACSDDGADEIEVTGVDYAYEGLPDTVAAGTSIAFRNDSDVEAHEFVAVRLPDDETRSVEELVQLPPDQLGALFAGVETVIVAAPGADGTVVEGDGTLTEPGRYAIVCVIPTGVDPDEYLAAAAESEGGPPDVPGGPPHIVNGMYAELEVTD